jgi:hypothetical protein
MEEAKDLYYVLSDRYQEDDLSSKFLLEVIERGLSHSNVIGFLVDSDSLGLDALKNICMEYVGSNYCKAIHEEGLEPLSHSLLLELLGEITETHF